MSHHTCKRTHYKSLYNGRIEFALFVKVLFKVLNDSQNQVLLERARQLVRECIGEQRLRRDLPYPTLTQTIAVPLRKLVGELHWEKANHYSKIYYNKLHRKRTEIIHNTILNAAA